MATRLGSSTDAASMIIGTVRRCGVVISIIGCDDALPGTGEAGRISISGGEVGRIRSNRAAVSTTCARTVGSSVDDPTGASPGPAAGTSAAAASGSASTTSPGSATTGSTTGSGATGSG
ncbi:MAG: hypothetical protein M3N98_13020, partial [Actinomycetota bacterium]|nr:hypothetical protein [Actinomycetota bacterium]